MGVASWDIIAVQIFPPVTCLSSSNSWFAKDLLWRQLTCSYPHWQDGKSDGLHPATTATSPTLPPNERLALFDCFASSTAVVALEDVSHPVTLAICGFNGIFGFPSARSVV